MLAIIGAAGAPFLDHRNSRTRRELAHGRWKIDVLVIHNEAKNAAAHAAAKTMKGLPARTDGEGWRFLLVKRTERLEVRARALERKIRADHLHDIVGRSDLLDVV